MKDGSKKSQVVFQELLIAFMKTNRTAPNTTSKSLREMKKEIAIQYSSSGPCIEQENIDPQNTFVSNKDSRLSRKKHNARVSEGNSNVEKPR